MATQAERSASTIAVLLAAARRRFARDGFHATSVEAIAGDAGLAKGAFYHHFSSKEEAFRRVLEGTQRELVEEVVRAAAVEGDPLERAQRGTRAFLAACIRPSVRRILLLDGPAVLGWDAWREIDSRHFGALLRGALAAAREAGLIAPRPLDALTHLLLGAITEAALCCARAPRPKRAVAEMAVELDHLFDRLRVR